MGKLYTVSTDENYPDFEDIVPKLNDHDVVEFMPGDYYIMGDPKTPDTVFLDKKVLLQSVFHDASHVNIHGHIIVYSDSVTNRTEIEIKNLKFSGTRFESPVLSVLKDSNINLLNVDILGIDKDASVIYINSSTVHGKNVNLESTRKNDAHDIKVDQSQAYFTDSSVGNVDCEGHSTVSLSNCSVNTFLCDGNSHLFCNDNLYLNGDDQIKLEIGIMGGSSVEINKLYHQGLRTFNAVVVQSGNLELGSVSSKMSNSLVITTDIPNKTNIKLHNYNNIMVNYHEKPE